MRSKAILKLSIACMAERHEFCHGARPSARGRPAEKCTCVCHKPKQHPKPNPKFLEDIVLVMKETP